MTWITIAFIHLRFRAALKAQGRFIDELQYVSPFFPIGPYIAILLGVIILMGQGFVYMVDTEVPTVLGFAQVYSIIFFNGSGARFVCITLLWL